MPAGWSAVRAGESIIIFGKISEQLMHLSGG